jgi:hypothetical protein
MSLWTGAGDPVVTACWSICAFILNFFGVNKDVISTTRHELDEGP